MGEPRPVLLERRGAVAVATLNAPERRNAIDKAMVDALHGVLDELQDDRELAALVLTGAGEKAFAAGADIAQLKERRSPDALAGINATLFKRVEDFPRPVIAAVRGFALGGGCELAMACDLRVAGDGARFGQPEVTLGIIPAAGGTYRLPRLVGLGVARELIYTGRIVEAAEALRLGLVNRVVADDEVLDQALAMAEQIAGNGREAVRMAKLALNALSRSQEGMAVAVESTAQALLFDSEDKVQRMEAFLQRKRSKR